MLRNSERRKRKINVSKSKKMRCGLKVEELEEVRVVRWRRKKVARGGGKKI